MMSHINDVLVKRAKKGYEQSESSSSMSGSQSESATGDKESGSGSYSQSRSGSRSGSYSQSGSRSGSGNYSQSRSGSGSRTQKSGSQSGSGVQSGSRRSQSQSQGGSKSVSQKQSQSGEQEENKSANENEEIEEEENENDEGSQNENDNNNSQKGSKDGSQGGSQNSKGSKKNSQHSKSGKSNSQKKANPPKTGKSSEKKDQKEYAFISIDNNNKKTNKEEEKNTGKSGKNELISLDNNISEKEEEKSIGGDKKAPNPVWKKYAKRYLNTGHNYVDNSYREDSYNFDIPDDKKKKKKKSDYSDENEEEEDEEDEEEEDDQSNDIKNEDKYSSNKFSKPKSENEDSISEKNQNQKKKKGKNKSKKNEELPAANLPFKTDLEKFQDEIKKFQKFSLIELYWFIIRKKHRIISLLIKKDVYDVFSIKLSLLILSYTIDFFVTTLFFFNSEIRKLFHIKKHLEPIYIIFMGIACILISTFLIKVIDYLMEYRTNFRRYEILQKYENDRSNYFSSLNGMIKSFKQKMIIYYVLMIAFSIFVWYMVSAFIATYYNTKLIWGSMIGINIGLSNIFPFLYYFLGVLFQYKGIHNESYRMYKFGLIMLKI